MSKMPPTSPEIIQRIHDAINRSVADRLEKDRLIRSLQADNLRLRHELAALKSRAVKTGRASTQPNASALDVSALDISK